MGRVVVRVIECSCSFGVHSFIMIPTLVSTQSSSTLVGEGHDSSLLSLVSGTL